MIGYATSRDGVAWKRMSARPVLSPEKPWEKVAVMCPHVLWDEQLKLFRMWYSGGEQYEPDAIGYATSPDGLAWTQHEANPIIKPDPGIPWEQHKTAGVQIIRPCINKWDHDACYKPYAIFDGKKWLLWYNGRHGKVEQIGVATHEGEDLGFEK